MKVTTGFSKPYVAVYTNNNGAVTYSEGMVAGRGVSVSIKPESSDAVDLYCDNTTAESVPGTFKSGTATLTIDGLEQDAEALIFGVTADEDGWLHFNDNQVTPFLGFGCVRRRLGGGKVTYQPMILTKVSADYVTDEAKTQEDSVDFQTTEITFNIKRDDTSTHEWHQLGKDFNTEAEAEAAVKKFLGISATSSSSGS